LPNAGRPNWEALFGAFDQLERAMGGLEATQRKMLHITATAWSDDRLIKAVVGPRGQLVDLEIDPRVYRKPNSKQLAATIVRTVRKAVEDAMRQSQEILGEGVPADLQLRKIGSLDLPRILSSHDADLAKEED